jgi:hypothetical protein
MFLSNVTRTIKDSTVDLVIFPVGTVIPYNGTTPPTFGWTRWNIADNGFCLYATESNLGTQTTASGGSTWSVQYLSTGGHTGDLGATFSTSIASSPGGPSVSYSSGFFGAHTHPTQASSVTTLTPRTVRFNFLVATAARPFLPENSLVFGDRFSSYGSEINQTTLTYISGQDNGTGTINDGITNQTQTITNSATGGAHIHATTSGGSLQTSTETSLTYTPATTGAHTHPGGSVSYNQTVFGPTIVLRLFQTLGELPPTEDVIVGYTGDLSKIQAPWYICNGENGTLDLREKFIGIDTSVTSGDVFLANQTRNTATLGNQTAISHSHRAGGTSNRQAWQIHRHDSASWNHTHTVETSYSDSPNIAARANLCFIQYKSKDNISYSIYSNLLSINENQSVSFTVSTFNIPNGTILYWSTTGSVNANDFTDEVLSGSLIVNNGTATIVRTLKNDFTTEGVENFRIELRTDSTSGTIVARSNLVTINDTSVETFNIVPNTTSVNEGSSVTFTVNTQGVTNGTTLFWTTSVVSGTVNASDFTDGVTSGSVVINNNVGTILREINNDITTEGVESFALELRTGSISGTIQATSSTVTISDTSLTQTFSVSPSVTSVNEGGSVTFTVTTTNVPNGTTLFWTTEQMTGTINASDFTDGVTSGTVVINSNTGSVVRTIQNDFTTEGAESFRLQIRTESISGIVRATSSTVSISDTSVETYSISSDVTSVNEGGSVTFTVTTQGILDGTTLFWTTQAVTGTVNVSDFTDGVTSGSFTINSNTGSVVRTLTNDAATEGAESFRLQIRTVSTSGTVVATSSTISVSDTSITPTYSISPSVTSVNEGGSVTFTVTTAGVANGTTLFWTTEQVTGTVNTSDFTDGVTSGSFTINSNTGSVVRTIQNDFTIEGAESFRLQIRTVSTSGTIVATSSTISISDTSIPTYTVTPNITTVNEGSSVTFTVNTQGVANGTTLFWTTTGTNITSSDFTDGVTSGSFTINSNTGSVVRTLTNDKLTEGAESFALQIRTVSTSGTVVATSSNVSISDTSTTSYSISPSVTSVNEGSSVTFTITTDVAPNGTTLFWTTTGTNITSSDFTDGVTSGSFTINSNTGSVVRILTNDATTEGAESFQLQVRTGSTGGPIVATSVSVTINDTSLTPTYSITPNITSVNEGSSVTFTVTTTNVPNGTILYWSTTGTISSLDFTDSTLTGTVTINSNTGSIVRSILNDNFTEGTESFSIRIRTVSQSGTIVATSSTVTINDTSRSPPQQIVFTSSSSWVVPTGVTSVSIFCVSGGGGGRVEPSSSARRGGGGSATGYRNNIPVTPGETLTIQVGGGGAGALSAVGGTGGKTRILRGSTELCVAQPGAGPNGGTFPNPDVPGVRYGRGGAGGTGTTTGGGVGGGGAGGYTTLTTNGDSVGGAGGQTGSTSGTGTRGGGGGGGSTTGGSARIGGKGGGVGLLGEGTSGVGVASVNATTGTAGNNGSGGGFGGGGAGGNSTTVTSASNGNAGAVRIIWPGSSRQYPSTGTADVG